MQEIKTALGMAMLVCSVSIVTILKMKYPDSTDTRLWLDHPGPLLFALLMTIVAGFVFSSIFNSEK